ncbi:hypothetical protein LOD99_8672 [Oopsacas minuta]|uniref:Uncharacterized protein n=1 Tax=Oopsacas minuta TaxID=111878 RepID=A0AAV7JFN7_9METZ|nr:hypothetical protein LOD99_8672 [Oopsacas minuta]
MQYLWPETNNEESEETNAEQEKIIVFLTIPYYLEKLISFGFIVCLDCFIFYFTLFPIRFVLSTLYICTKYIFGIQKKSSYYIHLFDTMRGLVLIISCLMLYYIDTSVVYHNLRGQSIIKSYVIFNMLEVIEKLMTSLGQDIYKAVFRFCVRFGKNEFENQNFLLFSIFYVLLFASFSIFHGFLILCQAVTLNIAMNSHNMALLTIMISNQFVELKGNVFRKFEEANLFQLACSDIRERLHVFIFLIIIIVRNLDQFAWNLDYFLDILPGVLLIFFSEWFLDWIKHAFIVKFNSIQSNFYQKCSLILTADLGASPTIITDHSLSLCKRMGLLCIPLQCVVCKIILESGTILQQSKSVIFLSIASAFVLKFILGYAVVRACRYKPLPRPRLRRNSNLSQLSSDSITSEEERSSYLIQDFPEDVQHSLRNRHPGATVKSNKSKKRALEEVGRFTLCSNAIV